MCINKFIVKYVLLRILIIGYECIISNYIAVMRQYMAKIGEAVIKKVLFGGNEFL